MARRRWLFGAASAVLLAAEIAIGLWVRDRFVRPYLGDVLVVMLLYCLIRTVIPRGCPWLSAAIFLFAVGVEFSQMLPLCDLLHITHPLLRTLMGTSFAVGDLWAYLAGNLLTGLADLFLWSRDRRDPS